MISLVISLGRFDVISHGRFDVISLGKFNVTIMTSHLTVHNDVILHTNYFCSQTEPHGYSHYTIPLYKLSIINRKVTK